VVQSLIQTPPSRFSRVGFSLVELLVVSAVIGVLIMLITPAVQAAREAARRVECKNNLKQLAIACHSHHDVHRFFPTGGWGWYWTGDADRGFGEDQPGGWIYNTLPYFEQYSLYDMVSDGEPDRLTREQRIGASQIIQTPLSVINCPSRRANAIYPMTANAGGSQGFFNSVTPKVAGRSDYAINSGHVFNEWPQHVLGSGPRSYEEARTWTANGYWGVDQAPFDRSVREQQVMTGVSYERSTVALRQITAGLTNTYLIGERHIPAEHYTTGLDIGDNETWCTGFNNDNYRKTGRLEKGHFVECAPIPDTQDGVPEHWGRFGSAHAGVWNIAFCDGSVRDMTYEIDWHIHRDHGSRFEK
jgi:prepilin-type N-terminal cleavage/methylation domain-containing protein